MKTIPNGVRVEIIQKSKSNDGNDRGLKLSFPEQLDKTHKEELVKILQKELIEVIQEPKEHSFIRVILEEFGFAVFDGISLPSQALEKIKELKEEENHHPLHWHTDGGIEIPSNFSALFSDIAGAVRQSTTVISHVDDIFPSLILSTGKMMEKLLSVNSPDSLQREWYEARRRLELVLVSRSKKQSNWDMVVHQVLYNLTRVIRLSADHKALTKGENKAFILDSISHAQSHGRVYLHQWNTPQTLLISNKRGFIHCRTPAPRHKEPGGKLFVKSVY
jgi:hypothetical protein